MIYLSTAFNSVANFEYIILCIHILPILNIRTHIKYAASAAGESSLPG